MRHINEIILHCTASDHHEHDSLWWVRKLHIGEFGWKDVGYHYVISKHKGIEIGRPIDKAGAHTRGMNNYSIGIALCGDKIFTPWQFDNLTNLCKNLMVIFNLDVDQINPHNRYNEHKTCPNFDIEIIKERLRGGSRARS